MVAAYDGPELFDTQENTVTTRIQIQQLPKDAPKADNTDSDNEIQTIRMGDSLLSPIRCCHSSYYCCVFCCFMFIVVVVSLAYILWPMWMLQPQVWL